VASSTRKRHAARIRRPSAGFCGVWRRRHIMRFMLTRGESCPGLPQLFAAAFPEAGFPVGRHPWRLPSANPPCTSISSKNPKTLRVRHVCAFRASPLVSVRARPLFPLRARLISFVRGSSLSAGYHKRRSGDQRRLTRSHTPCLFRLSARLSGDSAEAISQRCLGIRQAGASFQLMTFGVWSKFRLHYRNSPKSRACQEVYSAYRYSPCKEPSSAEKRISAGNPRTADH